ncbi:hypothetical protein NECID01_1279 [Nematocida sp. AWRm77]|nr:hypothetical protein NECID01_1279 [Nematocida sp. AWRm77]
MDSVNKVSSLVAELRALQESVEKTKKLLRKAVKESAQGKLSKKEKETVSLASADLSQSRFLQITLGVSEFKLPEQAKFKYKKDYETFKLSSTIIVSVWTALNLVFSNRISDTCQVLGHMYIYSTLIIREHILLNNGSHIKGWWLVHHYMCLIITGIMLTCPEESFIHIRAAILKFLFLLSCSQVVQYQYQMRRLYVLRSLTQAHPLETTNDVMSVSLAANLGIAIAILILFQGIQLYVAYYIYTIHKHYQWAHYQPLIGAALIGLMAVGNIATIAYTCYTKVEKRKAMRLSD